MPPSNPKVRAYLTAERQLRHSSRTAGIEKRGMAEPQILERFPTLAQLLMTGVRDDFVLFKIDLSPFSTYVRDWPAEEVSLFLDRYYRTVVEMVGAAGGVVEKYIGDAVIAVFSGPFSGDPMGKVVARVVLLGQTLVKELHESFGGELDSKAVIVRGVCFLGHVGPKAHSELTVIGNPLTDLFRLEERAERGSILLPDDLLALALPWLPGQEFKEPPAFLQSLSSGWSVRRGVRWADIPGVGSIVTAEIKRMG